MSLRISIVAERPNRVAGDVLGVVVGKKRKLLTSLPAGAVSKIEALMKERGFDGGWGAGETLIGADKGLATSLVSLLGMGDMKASDDRIKEGIRRAVGNMVQEARRHGAREAVIDLSADEADKKQVVGWAGAVAEAALLANYRYTEFSRQVKREQRSKSLKSLTILVGEELVGDAKREVKRRSDIEAGVTLTRDLVNMPASEVTPAYLVQEAKRISGEYDRITSKIFNANQAEKEGFNAFLAVAKGSTVEPYVIHLTYKPDMVDENTKKVVLVGKGITFDSGGLSLKPAQYMEAMKNDMGGAATVLGVFEALKKIRPQVEVHGVIAACENMPSGDAYRPGDVVTAKNGKTIEILNTDAEGRVTLADALSYAVEMKPDAVIDFATLTGACVVALGETVAGLWETDDDLRKGLLKAAKRAGEGLDDMPMPDEYRPLINSRVADLRNIGTTRTGDAILAAMFLREFVGKTPWAHVDFGGPAFAENVVLPYHVKGATGYGVATVMEYLGGL